MQLQGHGVAGRQFGAGAASRSELPARELVGRPPPRAAVEGRAGRLCPLGSNELRACMSLCVPATRLEQHRCGECGMQGAAGEVVLEGIASVTSR